MYDACLNQDVSIEGFILEFGDLTKEGQVSTKQNIIFLNSINSEFRT